MNFQSIVERKINPQGQSGNDTIYPCPRCEDLETGHHLYVNYDKGYWHCFKCNAGGKRLESLLKLLNLDIDYDYDKLYSDHDKDLDDIITPKKSIKLSVKEYSTDLHVLTEYYNLHTTPLSREAQQYLLDRGVSFYLQDKLKLREGLNRFGESFSIKGINYVGRDYSGRVLIPSLRRDNTISFYVARDYIGGKNPKYLNPPKELSVASEDVWNLDMIDSESVIICEGVFTAIHASPIKLNACATYGKSIAHKSSSDVKVTSQGEKLLNRKFKNYYIAYDADAYSAAIDTCKYLHDRGANVYLVKIDPNKYGAKADVADIGYQEFLKLMHQAVKYTGDLDFI